MQYARREIEPFGDLTVNDLAVNSNGAHRSAA
jgi:hypothetical protein